MIQALIAADPSSINQKHIYTGSVPLHAVYYNPYMSSSKRTAITKILLEACPLSIKTTNNDGKTALHTNASQHCNYEPTVLLLKAAPEIAEWKDNDGNLPLHCACRSHKSPSKSIIAIFRQYPAAIVTRNKAGLTPVDEARMCALTSDKKESRLQVLKKLLLEYKSGYQSVEESGHGHKKRKIDLRAPSRNYDDRNFEGDERDDTGTMQRNDDGIRMPSLGGAVSISDDLNGRETTNSSSTGTDQNDLDVIPPSILLAMMKNHTVI